MRKILLTFVLLIIACGNDSGKNEKTETAQVNPHKQLSWNVPQGWIEEPPNSAMRKAQFSLPKVTGDPEDATVVVFYFQGEGGSVDANLKRWYGQIVQPDGRSTEEVAEVSKSEVNGLSQTMVDVSGTYLFQSTPMSSQTTEKPDFRMLAAVVQTSSGPWFVKMVGPKKTVSHWQNSFYEFMKTFKQ